MNLGENIYRLRTERNMSQGDLADALDVSRQSVSKWENNSAIPELEKLIKMSQLFSVTLDELVTGEEIAPPTPVPEAAPASTERFPARKIIGIVLLSFGLLCIIVCTILAILMGNLYEDDFMTVGFVFGLPLLLCGILFLSVRHNPGYWCVVSLYFAVWLVLISVVRRFGAMAFLIRTAHTAVGLCLLIRTLIRFRSDRLHMPKWGKILVSILLLLSVLMNTISMLPVMEIPAGSPANDGTEVTQACASVSPE